MSDTVHVLKCWPGTFAAICDGRKRFEVRRDDRGFKVGDVLELKEWEPCENCNATGRVIDCDDGESIACSCAMTEHPSGAYSGRFHRARVTYILRDGFGVPDGYCTMSIEGIVGDMSDPTQRDVPSKTDRNWAIAWGASHQCGNVSCNCVDGITPTLAAAREEGWREGLEEIALSCEERSNHWLHVLADPNAVDVGVPLTFTRPTVEGRIQGWFEIRDSIRARIEREKGNP